MFDIDVPVEVNVGDSTDLAFEDHFTQFAVDGIVAVVESTNQFAFGFVFSFEDAESIFAVGGHGFFADDFEVVFQTANDIIDVVHSGHPPIPRRGILTFQSQIV